MSLSAVETWRSRLGKGPVEEGKRDIVLVLRPARDPTPGGGVEILTVSAKPRSSGFEDAAAVEAS